MRKTLVEVEQRNLVKITWKNLPLLCQQKQLILMPQVRQGSSPLPRLRLRLLPPPTNPKKRKKSFPNGEKICVIDGQALERHLSAQIKARLRRLFNYTSVDGKSTEDPRNFPQAPVVITLIRNTGVGI